MINQNKNNMRKLYLSTVGLFLLASCASNDEPSSVSQKLMTFNIQGDFTSNYEDMSRASATDAGMTDIWAFDYVDGILKQQVHQSSTSADFGTIQLPMSYGTHSVKFVASKGDAPVLSGSPLSITWTKPKDTFTLDYPLTVAPSDNGARTPQLQRAVSAVKLLFTDKVPTNASEIQITIDRSTSLSIQTLTAGDATPGTNILAIPATWLGKSGGDITTYTLCDDEITTDVSVLVLDTGGNSLSSFTVKDVTLKRNRITTLKGEVFSRGSAFTVSVNDTWDQGLEVEF